MKLILSSWKILEANLGFVPTSIYGNGRQKVEANSGYLQVL
jgi:hypothetical protein